jgi:hypothetical protein
MAAVVTKQKIEKFAFSWKTFIVSLMCLGVFSQTETAARAYGLIDPAVTPIQVTSIQSIQLPSLSGIPRTASIISGEADILREECDYIDLTWKLSGGEKSIEVEAFFEDPPEVRTKGRQYWRALVVNVPPDQLYQTKGYANHRCGAFPIQSPFYLPPAPDPVATMLGANAECKSGAFSTSTGSGTCSHHGGVLRWLPSEDNA